MFPSGGEILAGHLISRILPTHWSLGNTMIFVHFVKLHFKYMIYLLPPLLQIFVASALEHLDRFASLIKNPPQCGRPGFSPWVGEIPWRKEQPPTPLFWSREFHRLYIVHGVTKRWT